MLTVLTLRIVLPWSLCSCYTVSGTDVVYRATRPPAVLRRCPERSPPSPGTSPSTAQRCTDCGHTGTQDCGTLVLKAAPLSTDVSTLVLRIARLCPKNR
eukprot:406785-Rhodomonas_salina.1